MGLATIWLVHKLGCHLSTGEPHLRPHLIEHIHRMHRVIHTKKAVIHMWKHSSVHTKAQSHYVSN
jgi:hypothetical protein